MDGSVHLCYATSKMKITCGCYALCLYSYHFSAYDVVKQIEEPHHYSDLQAIYTNTGKFINTIFDHFLNI